MPRHVPLDSVQVEHQSERTVVVDAWPVVWRVLILGPEQTPYEGGLFTLDLSFPETYPFRPPTATFKTPIYHCNVGEDGGVCHELLKDKWSPAMSVEAILIGVVSLLKSPHPEAASARRPAVADEYLKQRVEHDRKAKECTNMHAFSGCV
jgi:ubiquitin-conjugating enzyme E2 D/E